MRQSESCYNWHGLGDLGVNGIAVLKMAQEELPTIIRQFGEVGAESLKDVNPTTAAEAAVNLRGFMTGHRGEATPDEIDRARSRR